MDTFKFLRASTFAALLGAAFSAHADLVTDGNFESAASHAPAGSTTAFTAGQTFDGYWTVGGTGVGIDTDDGFNISGRKSVFLDYADVNDSPTDGPGSITQTIATTAGQSYLFSFDVHVDDVSAFTATFGSTTLLSNAQVPISTPPVPTHFSFTVTATSASTAIFFSGSSDAFATVELDNVSVTPQATPEPATVAALGLGAFAFVRRRRR